MKYGFNVYVLRGWFGGEKQHMQQQSPAKDAKPKVENGIHLPQRFVAQNKITLRPEFFRATNIISLKFFRIVESYF